MNAVDVSFAEGLEGGPGTAMEELVPAAETYALSVLAKLEKDNWDLSLVFCDDPFIRDLNGRYRGKDEATDVLSFEQGDTYADEAGCKRLLAGDIVISLETLERNAAEFSVSRGEELRRLVVHGILHLSGLDHEDNEATRPMLRLQERLLAEIGPGKGPFE
ncbi:MAG TPA: rRNA maturation RNase YbeY [Rectinemataceae bacterium]|nr:rRNA maturation RNase YbeY [Rectinemataceae bacterium]